MRTATELEFSCIRYLLANMSISQLVYSVTKYLLYRRKRPAVNDDSYIELVKVITKQEVVREAMLKQKSRGGATMENDTPECKAMCFLYDEIDPIIMENASLETRVLIQPTINRLKISLKDRCNESLEKMRDFKNEQQ